MKALKILGTLIAVLLVGLTITFFAARFSDGPIGMIPGGPFTSGEINSYFMTGWERARDVDTIELQLADEDTSRTTWIVVDLAGRGYIPANLGFPPGKSWHLRADGDGRAILRILGKRYDVRLDRISDPETEATVVEMIGRKYASGLLSAAGTWIFKITSTAPMPYFRL